MLNTALALLVLGLFAGVLGFSGLAGTAAAIAKVCAIVFLVLFAAGMVFGKRVRT